MKNIVFIGLPGCGKTEISKRVASALDIQWYDSDLEIEKSERLSIPQIFERYGEDYFRVKETERIRKLISLSGAVLSLGGGAVLRNSALIKHNSVVFFIDRSVENILKTLEPDTRPLLKEPSRLYELKNQRYEMYTSICDYHIFNNKSIDHAVSHVTKLAAKERRKMKLMIINGPNLNLLGKREPGVYGSESYEALSDMIKAFAREHDIDVEIAQYNSEGDIIDAIQSSEGFDGLIINPGAYTHYSYAIHDAIKAVSVKAVEVHISNIAARESFRHTSVTAPACIGQISGLGFYGYIAAMLYFIKPR